MSIISRVFVISCCGMMVLVLMMRVVVCHLVYDFLRLGADLLLRLLERRLLLMDNAALIHGNAAITVSFRHVLESSHDVVR